MRAPIFTLRLLPVLAFFYAGTIAATPWIDPGDLALRNDIQLLADAGVIRGPITTWPLSWGDLLTNLADHQETLGHAERQALSRVHQAQKIATQPNVLALRLQAALASRPRELRTFENTPRESAEITAGADWTGLRFSYRLQATVVTGADDGRTARRDGSYAGVVLGNYMLAVGELERWWGPGWDGSLILSTNARPVPALSLRRNFSDPFKNRWLRWMGPWTISALVGQLEGGRSVPDTRYFGLRVNFRPTRNLEIGVSRTAQWCGDGRPCDAETFADLLLGQDNRGESTDLSKEPGNQLAGVDWRWRLPVRLPVAWYGQFIGEDEAGGLPSRMIGQLGIESWGYSSRLAGMLRGHLEFADTAAEFYKNQVRYDYAYEHFIYEDGYRYRGRSIGHSMDNDGRMISAGITLNTDNGDQWRGLFRVVDLNRGGSDANPVASSSLDLINVELGYTRVMSGGRLDFSIGLDQVDNWITAEDDTEIRGHIKWQSNL
ncbi:MAG: capsule assembly Wzi family protein [Gammaproteobacteria bacterium]|nr:capsule assembly Wzi family protein [Gammaproteobacteria bacterium]